MRKTFKTNGRLLSQIFSSYNTTFDALCELINNSIQAKSTQIDIEVDLVDDDEGLNPCPFTEYRIIDNGEGVSSSEFDRKILEIATDTKEGKGKGIGRFAAFQIGSTVTINTTAFDNQLQQYTNTSITLDTASLTQRDIASCDFDVISQNLDKKPKNTFYKISIKNFWDEMEIEKNPKKRLSPKLLPDRLEEELFLKYSSYIVTDKIIFSINGKKLSKADFLIGEIENGDFEYTFSDDSVEKVCLEYINYKGKSKKIILAYRVNNNDMKLSGYEDLMDLDYPDENSWLVYIDCNYFNNNTDTFRNLSFDGLDEDLANIKKIVKNTVRSFLKEKHKEYYAFEAKLVSDKYYPYIKNPPSSSKKYTFNQLAYFIEKDYSILANNIDTRRIIYQLLDKALNNGDIIEILESIISLDNERVKMFKKLLEDSDLGAIIKFTADIVNKQKFLDFLYEIIYGDIGKYLKERSQLHKIIERNLWIFGEEYSNTPALFSDKSLKNSLEVLKDKYFRYIPTKEDDNLIDDIESEIADIPDIMMYNDKPLPNGKHEIMVIELKAPKVKIGQTELQQADKYGYDIESMGKFSQLNTSYKIYLISSDITPFAKSRIGTDPNYPTRYHISKDYDIEIHVIKWSDIIDANRQHLKFLGASLETKDIDAQNMLKSDYSDLDITNIEVEIKKLKNKV